MNGAAAEWRRRGGTVEPRKEEGDEAGNAGSGRAGGSDGAAGTAAPRYGLNGRSINGKWRTPAVKREGRATVRCEAL